MNSSSTQIETDVEWLEDNCGMDSHEVDEIIGACEELGGISAEYFCEEFVFETGNPDDIGRLHDPEYLRINWSLQ